MPCSHLPPQSHPNIQLAKDIGIVSIIMDETKKQRVGRLLFMIVIDTVAFILRIHHQQAGDKTGAKMFITFRDT